MMEKTSSAFLDVKALAPIITFLDQLLLDKTTGKPTPMGRRSLFSIESITELPGIRPSLLCELFQQDLRFN